MKNTLKMIISFLGVITMISSCTVEPKEIQYGNDHCSYCDMTVVDRSHAAEYTTKKGKSYSFDSIECLIGQLNNDNNESDMAFLLVADFDNPGILVDATTATYLISEKIKSPMGANLSAFDSKEKAIAIQEKNGGELFTWGEIKIKLSKQ